MQSITTYPGAPSIAGLVFRHLRTPDDLPAMNAVANAMRAADGDGWATSDEQFQMFYENLSNCDPATDVMVVEQDGRIVAYARAAWHEELDGLRVYEPITFIDPSRPLEQWAAMHDTMEARLRAIAGTHTAGHKKVFQDSANEAANERVAVLRDRGYDAVRFGYTMVRPTLEDLPEAALPEGLEIRDVRPEQMRSIWEAENEAFRDHWGTGVPSEEDHRQFLTDPVKSDTSLWRVAWDGDDVAGMVRSFINEEENRRYGRARGYVENISVRRPWRRRGLARSLIAASFPLLRARGMTEGALGVDTGNPNGALRLYESCGFVPVSTEIVFRKPLE